MQSGGQKTSNEAALDQEVQGGVVREVKNGTGCAHSAK